MAARPKILITGGRGQLGTDLVSYLSNEYEVLACDLPEFDVCDPDTVRTTLERTAPGIVIHAAACTDVDGCESEPEHAMAVNQEGTRRVAESCRTLGARLIYYSTDYVFRGDSERPYVESDQPKPLNVYGRSKLAGEKAVQDNLNNYAIIRIGWMYGQHGMSFVKTITNAALKRMSSAPGGQAPAPLRVVDDQYGSPTWTMDVVRQTEALLSDDWQGVFHATSARETNWCSFAREILAQLQIEVDVQSCTTADLGRPALRPMRSTLANARLAKAGNDLMRDWHDGLTEFIANHGKGLIG